MTALLQDFARRSADREPAATAVVLGEEALTYGELVDRAGRLARALHDRGVGPGDRVAMLVPKSPAAIVTMHAVLEAGAAYVPVDLSSPARRVARILRAAEPRAAVVAGPAQALVRALREDGALAGVQTVAVDAGWPEEIGCDVPEGEWAALEPWSAPRRDAADQLAHLLFTSGSTGAPKGVQVLHRTVAAFIGWAVSEFGIAAGDRVSSHPPLHFDLSTFDVYGTLAAGATLHLVPQRANLLPRELARFIREGELTQWFSVPSTLAYLSRAGAVAEGDFPALQRVLFCGEAMPAPVLRDWMRRVPHARYTNLYGPTETTIASTYHHFDVPLASDTEPVPIGRPCAGEEVLVVDEDLREVPPGERGELVIGGAGVNPGYWRDEARTAAVFVPDPRRPGQRLYRTGDIGWLGDDGLLRFSGRVDAQIKHRGYRIELGEIEAALDATGLVREAAVVAVEAPGFSGTEICCGYVAASAGLQVTALRAALSAALPPYMLPTRWQDYDALPKNQNDKIDRVALRAAFAPEPVPATR